jgi:hypothetical protein
MKHEAMIINQKIWSIRSMVAFLVIICLGGIAQYTNPLIPTIFAIPCIFVIIFHVLWLLKEAASGNLLQSKVLAVVLILSLYPLSAWYLAFGRHVK